jgi:hypothetical protein
MPPGYTYIDVPVAETPPVPGKVFEVDDVDPKAGNPDRRSEPRKQMEKIFEEDSKKLEETKPKLHKASRFLQSVVGRGIVNGSILAVTALPGMGPVAPFLHAVAGVAGGASAGEMFAVNQLEQNSLKDVNKVCGDVLKTKFQELWERNRQRDDSTGVTDVNHLLPPEKELYDGILDLVKQSLVNQAAYDTSLTEDLINENVKKVLKEIDETGEIGTYLNAVVYSHNSTAQVKGWRPPLAGGTPPVPPSPNAPAATAEPPNDIVASFVEMAFHAAEPAQRKELIDTLHKSYANLTNIASEQGLRIDQATAAAEANALLHKKDTYFDREFEKFRHGFRNLPWYARACAGLGAGLLGTGAFIAGGPLFGAGIAIGINAAYGALSGRELVSGGAIAYKHSAAVDGIRRGFLSVAQRKEYEHDLKAFFHNDEYKKSTLEHHRSRAKEVLKRRRIGFGATGAIAALVGQWFNYSNHAKSEALASAGPDSHIIPASHTVAEVEPSPGLHLHDASTMASQVPEGQALYDVGPDADKALAEQVVIGWSGKSGTTLTEDQREAMIDKLSDSWRDRHIFNADGSLSKDIDFNELRAQIDGMGEAKSAFETMSSDAVVETVSGPGIVGGDREIVDAGESVATTVETPAASFASVTDNTLKLVDSTQVEQFMKDPEIDRLITEAVRSENPSDSRLYREEVTNALTGFTTTLREKLLEFKRESGGNTAAFREKIDTLADSIIVKLEKSELMGLSESEKTLLRSSMGEAGNTEIRTIVPALDNKLYLGIENLRNAFENTNTSPDGTNQASATRIMSRLFGSLYRTAMKS